MEKPSWYDGKMIDEVAFCASFLHQHPMKCVRNRLFTVDGMIEDEGKMDLERKGVQSYQSQLYARFLCFVNGALTALHDQSDGFFRRQIVLTTKDRPADRTDDPFLVGKLMSEMEGIFLWCLEGLHRLLANNYQFTIS